MLEGKTKHLHQLGASLNVFHHQAHVPTRRPPTSFLPHFFQRHNSTNILAMEPIEAALEHLKLTESFTYAAVADKYGVDRTTLSRRHRGLQTSRAIQKENERSLNATQSSQLIKYIEKLSARGLPPTADMVRNFASEIAGKYMGKNWVARFLERHHHKLFSRYSNSIDRCRFQADSAAKYTLYFNLLSQKIQQYNIDSRQIYNMDEKGFLIGILGKQKRIFSKDSYGRLGGSSSIQDGNREWITVLACICADGQALPPALIYQAASGKLQDTWLQDFEPENNRIYLGASPTGWTNNELGLAWLEQVFDRETKAKARRAYRLLIVDGHGSHLTMEFIEYCDQNRILLAILPPHSTHTLQPLDVGLFSPLATAYRAALRNFLHQSQGLTAITKRDFFRLFWVAWGCSFVETTIKKAFETTGIAPLNPEQILTKFNTKAGSRPNSSCSTASLTKASGTATIERLVYNLKAQPFGYEARLLTKAIVKLATENTLLHQENLGLREAFLNEKKRRQRGKALLLQPPEQYAGGAVFYSPSKVQRARELQQQKELNEEQSQHQKDEAKQQRAEQKQLKLQEADLKRQSKLQAKEARAALELEKQQQRQEEKEAKSIEKQLKLDVQLSQLGKRQGLKAKGKAKAKVGGVVDTIAREEPSEAVSVSTRSGRKINLPKKFK